MPVLKRYGTKTVLDVQVTDLQCNVCSKLQSSDCKEMHTISLSGGFFGVYPSDMSSITFVVCGSCLQTWTNTFQIPPAEGDWDLMGGSNEQTTYEVTHYETDVRYLVEDGMARPVGTDVPENWPSFKEDEDEYESHPKGSLYRSAEVQADFYVQVIDEVPFYPDGRYLIVYRVLEEGDPIFACTREGFFSNHTFVSRKGG